MTKFDIRDYYQIVCKSHSDGQYTLILMEFNLAVPSLLDMLKVAQENLTKSLWMQK